MAAVPTIETPRLILRHWRDSDLEPWVEMHADPLVTEFFPRRFTRDVCEPMAMTMAKELERLGYGWWVLEVRDGAAFAGVICLQDVPFHAHFTPAREVGWRLTSANWGHGYATEGARAALDFAFDQLGWHEVVAMTAALNVRSRRVMERLGMSHDGADDFGHPHITQESPLRRHVLYRIAASRRGV